jgi:hypothetical protein
MTDILQTINEGTAGTPVPQDILEKLRQRATANMTPEQCAERDAERQEWQRKQQAERIERLLADDDAHQRILCDRNESRWFEDQSEGVEHIISQLEPSG